MFIDFDHIDKKEKEAKKYINEIKSSKEESDFHKLAKWILSTEDDSIFLPGNGYEYGYDSYGDVYSLLTNIHHAMVDDGSISVCTINESSYNQSYIVFFQENDFSVGKGYEEQVYQVRVAECLQKAGYPIIQNIENIEHRLLGEGLDLSVDDFIKMKHNERENELKKLVKFSYLFKKEDKEKVKETYKNSYPDIEVKEEWFKEFDKIKHKKAKKRIK